MVCCLWGDQPAEGHAWLKNTRPANANVNTDTITADLHAAEYEITATSVLRTIEYALQRHRLREFFQ